MAIIDYDKRENITERERLKSLRDSVQRAFDEHENKISEETKKTNDEVSAVADYCKKVETINGWKVFRYASGKVEIYKRASITLPAFTAKDGHYRAITNKSLPFKIPYNSRLEMSGIATVSGASIMVNSDNETTGEDKIEIVGYSEVAKSTTTDLKMSIKITALL